MFLAALAPRKQKAFGLIPSFIGVSHQLLMLLPSFVAECALAADVPVPEAVFIVPDCNACAYSAGMPASKRTPDRYVLIEAPLLACLGRADLSAIVYHEYGHVVLRRRLWAARSMPPAVRLTASRIQLPLQYRPTVSWYLREIKAIEGR
ncbi:MAG: hypothetical protein DMG06_17665 [Acidobacteria bacterium]|nr:MAG: hypothetical protein DMG06_17665 [Acidobacteriota bacterium]